MAFTLHPERASCCPGMLLQGRPHAPLVQPQHGRRHHVCAGRQHRLLSVCQAAPPAAAEAEPKKKRPGENKGFVEEMRFVAMRLHTKDQAPKEGQQKAAETPWQKWQPTLEGYLRFLVESRAVYQTLEDVVQSAPHPDYERFRGTGLERTAPLAEDIAWMEAEHGLKAAPLQDDGPGREYSRLLAGLAERDPPSFLCHFYNVYFAHTAGGRMIGAKIAQLLLGGRTLRFYEYEGDVRAVLGLMGQVKEKLNGVRDQLNAVAEGWTREEKDRCLEQTAESFKYSGNLLRVITAPPSES